MKPPLFYIALFLLGSLTYSCESSFWSGSKGPNNPEDTSSGSWLIPKSKVYEGGPGKDGIPSIDKPRFIPVDQVNYLENDDLVLGFKNGQDIRAYPHAILNWHEIVNDRAGDHHIAVTYCPLTGTGIGWDRNIDGNVTTFGVSGLLYNSNLIPYDRATDSYWSQMLYKSIHGKKIKTPADHLQLVETTWGTWKKMYPQSQILSTNTGYDRDYTSYPYGDYKNSPNLLFPVESRDERLFEKKRVMGILSQNRAKVYLLKHFPGKTSIINDTFQEEKFIIAGSREASFMVAYKRVMQNKEGKTLHFKAVEDSLPVIMKDQHGNLWNIFGEAVAGPHKGHKLQTTKSFTGFWFSWAAFYQNTSIYEGK